MRSLSCELHDRVLHLLPHGGARINDLEVTDVGHGDELDVFTGFLFAFGVALAEFVRHRIIGCAVDKDLLCGDVLLGG